MEAIFDEVMALGKTLVIAIQTSFAPAWREERNHNWRCRSGSEICIFGAEG